MAKDPYRYFRIEAQELLEGLNQGFLQMEKSPSVEVVSRVLRQAHTLKGASRVVKRGDIGDLAHEMEDILVGHRQTGGPVGRDEIDRLFALLDRVRDLAASLGQSSTTASTSSAAPAVEIEGDEQSLRIAMRELDNLLDGAFGAQAAASALQQTIDEVKAVCERTRDLLVDNRVTGNDPWAMKAQRAANDLDTLRKLLDERSHSLAGELAEVRAAASDIRLVSAQTLIADLERIARDAARSLDKEIDFSSRGGDTHIDAHVLFGVRKALVHLVRNAVAHGIESPSRRTRAGKAAAGSVEVRVERRGHRVSIQCRDDGRGLDVESVRRMVVERGFVSAQQAASLDAPALAQLLLRGGVSTSRGIDSVSGRGVGLEIVRLAVEELEGEVTFQSAAGMGTTVEIVVPLSLSAVPVLSLQLDDATVVVPLDHVRTALRIAAEDIIRDSEGEKLVVDGEVVPFLPLRRALRVRSEHPETQSVAVLEAEGRTAAIGVDRLGGARTIVMRAIPEHASAHPIVAGATLGEDGLPQLVLGAVALVREATIPIVPEARPAVRQTPPVLVIDDSLTTRMLEQSILESAGYEVDLAVSGEDGIEKARKRRYGVFIVDVEMPGMNGFEFIAKVRADPELRHTPAILVTSRADPEDKRRGKQVGARAYIVKSEFDQAVLLDTIRRLGG